MKITTGIALAGSVALSPAVTAEIVDLAWTGLSQARLVTWGYDASQSWDYSVEVSDGPGWLGRYLFNDGDYSGYCYDLDAPVSSDPVSYEVLNWTELGSEAQDRARFLASLYDQWYLNVQETGDADMGAALAFLTNEIMEENYDFIPGTWILEDVQLQSSTTMGGVQFSGFSEDAEEHYQAMLASLDFGTDAMLDALVFYQSTSGEWQDFVGYVPAPSALALLGLAGLAGRRRRNG